MMNTAAQEAWDRNYPSGEHDGAFVDGARWYAAGMAVCEFLSDLAAASRAVCQTCDGRRELPGYPHSRLCHICHGTGKRVVP